MVAWHEINVCRYALEAACLVRAEVQLRRMGRAPEIVKVFGVVQTGAATQPYPVGRVRRAWHDVLFPLKGLAHAVPRRDGGGSVGRAGSGCSGRDLLARAGVDAVIVTAATKSSEPMHQAALMCRKRGRIVLVGVTGLTLSRDDFFKKELTFQVPAS